MIYTLRVMQLDFSLNVVFTLLINKNQGSQVPEPFSDKEASLDSSGSLDYNKDAKKDVEIDISASNIKEQAHHPIIQLEGRNIDDLWNDYNNLTQEQFKTLTVKDFNLIIETFRKFLKGSDFSDKSDKSLI
ncbi:unnamed protein product [Rhizophagus irregularis]|nr:unnamed protein product [Rhizophagus irregularis]